ncbi:hypothetical protein C1I63_06290 [Rathayibacter caricis DSM 15933]|uniref:Membrane-associated oxidoreductase n=1 Tax=Rathayibacter caricis DSM 15933 TaxID=1328867 RepID=A0A2T4USJ4_9MICO|nr:hypothetical protein C1I63_06290 [Rathayibacter caricis DSM 15933]
MLTGTMNLAEGFTCIGQANLFGARLARLEAGRSSFVNGDGKAINANYLSVDGLVSLEHARIDGQIQAIGASIGGQLDMTDLRAKSADEYTLEIDSAVVRGGIQLQDAIVDGGIWLVGLTSEGELAFHRAQVNAPRARAIDASSTTLGAVDFTDATIRGEVKIAGAQLRVLDCTSATFVDADKRSLDLDGSTVSGAVHAHFASITGTLDLTNVSMETYRDTRSSWPPSAALIGASFRRLEGDEDKIGASAKDVAARLDWIRLDDRFHPQKYAAVATAYRNVGRESFATEVLMAGRRDSNAGKKGFDAAFSAALSAIMRVTVGYGFRLRRAVIWLLGMIAVGAFCLQRASDAELLRPDESASPTPQLNTLLLAVDLLFPVVSLGQADAFTPFGWAQYLTAFMSILGWLLAAIVVAALAGVLQRRQD